MRIQFCHTFEEIIAIENILDAWQEFIKGKRSKQDVQEFEHGLLENVFRLHADLVNKTYKHGGYTPFNISDPKPRNIHKASVRDRLLHHAIYRKLYPFFDRTFIADSYSCRIAKGTHKAIERFIEFGRMVSQNNGRTCWVLKCDIRKFFSNINHHILMDILRLYIPDKEILWLLNNVVQSFETQPGVGLPLGNLTSQLLVNIYMNEFDQYIKHRVKAKHYIRYADDFVILSHDKRWLENVLVYAEQFLREKLQLEMHPNKVFIKTLASGVDFLGWVHFPMHRVLRTTTRKRLQKNIDSHPSKETIISYLGLLQHGNAFHLHQTLLHKLLQLEYVPQKEERSAQ